MLQFSLLLGFVCFGFFARIWKILLIFQFKNYSKGFPKISYYLLAYHSSLGHKVLRCEEAIVLPETRKQKHHQIRFNLLHNLPFPCCNVKIMAKKIRKILFNSSLNWFPMTEKFTINISQSSNKAIPFYWTYEIMNLSVPQDLICCLTASV